ncbi:MAG: site-specific integrase [Saprospiraceae bacterium]
MASSKVVLFTSKTLKNGEHPIMLRLIQNRNIKYINLHASCLPDLWDEENNLPKKQHPHFHQLKVLIRSRLLESEKAILELEQENRPYTLEELCKRMAIEQKRQQTSVLQYFEAVINRLNLSGRLGYAAVFTSTRNYLLNFREGRDFEFADITHSFIVGFDEYLLRRGLKPNAAFVPIRTFKTLLNYAKKEGFVRVEYNPFKEFSFTKYRRDKPVKRALSREDIRKIELLELTPGTPEYHAKNYFIFSYYCAGINFIDLAYLRWENIQNGRLVYVRRKTKEQLSPIILEPAKVILKYYQNEFPNLAGYIFPILDEKHQSLKSKDYRIDKVLRQVNKALKEIAQQIGIESKLTTYVARHSFATNLKKKGVATALISQALGHESERTTQIYLDSFENEIIDEAVKSLL